ncbi:MAG: NAD(P)-binding protein [Alkalinema sp. RU_4_3]|nr:NAD(P)-binding protein [Alkalinema sp. RU_4_3]
MGHPPQPNFHHPIAGPKIAVVGAGLAGLTCTYELRRAGLVATLYEASDRVGGRCYSLAGFFPGQVVELGGELIDSQHHTLLNYAREFGLTLEDYAENLGEGAFYFNQQRYSEATIIEEYRELLRSMQSDLQRISRAPTALNHSPIDAELDGLSIQEYLDRHQAGPLIESFIRAGYQGEYGLPIEEQTCLHFLLVNQDKDLDQGAFEIFSDERYHIREGNDRIAHHLAEGIQGQIELGMQLVRLSRNGCNQIVLTFDQAGKTQEILADAAVITIPFPVLRHIDLDDSLELPDWKQTMIRSLDSGTQAKLMIGFKARPWDQPGGSQAMAHSDLSHHQMSWETNVIDASSDRAVLTSLASGHLGASLETHRSQGAAEALLQNYDRIYPGAGIAADRDHSGQLRAILQQWSDHPLCMGGYACYRPRQLTAFAEREGEAIHNLFFAGEHTNSFHEWQGFLEGAAISGIQAAKQILLRCGVLP